MHETGVIKSLIHEVERVTRSYGGNKVRSVRVHVGVLCPFSDDHLLEHFQQQSQDTLAGQAVLTIEHGTDPTDPMAMDVGLLTIEIEDVIPKVGRIRVVRTD